MNILDFYKKKQQAEKIAMVTCYDYTSARIIADTEVDCILVGDSAAMTMHGFDSTLPATIEMMQYHVAAVKRGAGKKFIIGDLPFLSYRKSLAENIASAQALMQSGAHAVKLEGARGNNELIRHLVESGVPVMGHLGLTPQAVHALGGYRVQGKQKEAARAILEDAVALQEAGCFAVVLECVPSELAKKISETLLIPTIGIGAGSDTDGQVLVLQDLLGLSQEFSAKFVKKFMDGGTLFKEAINHFALAVKNKEFPSHEHGY